jgi:hypothetical protein
MACQVFEENGILAILGDRRRNVVEIFDADTTSALGLPADVIVRCDGRDYAPAGPITEIRVDLGSGNDDLAYYLGDPGISANFQAPPTRLLNVAMGQGNDQVRMLIDGFTGVSDDARGLGPGSWSIQVDLGTGNDRFALDLAADMVGVDLGSSVSASDLYVIAYGGPGHDLMDVVISQPVILSQVYLDFILRGGSGNDTLGVDAPNSLAATDSTIVIERYGESGRDRLDGVFVYETVGDVIVDHVIDGGPGPDLVSVVIRNRSRRPTV